MPVTPDSKRFLHPEAIKRVARMELRARHIVEGFLSGMHRSPYFGQSVEFLQHREYSVGDDLRHVDWKVWAAWMAVFFVFSAIAPRDAHFDAAHYHLQNGWSF